jgi:hypothetical protein
MLFNLNSEKYHNNGMAGYQQKNLTWEEVGDMMVLLTRMGYSRFHLHAVEVGEDFSGYAKSILPRIKKAKQDPSGS